MQDVDPKAFDLEELKRRQFLQERKTLTAEMILGDINATQLENVATAGVLDTLIGFVPNLSIYSNQIKMWEADTLSIHPIPQNHHPSCYEQH
jgi:hypothetical protein